MNKQVPFSVKAAQEVKATGHLSAKTVRKVAHRAVHVATGVYLGVTGFFGIAGQQEDGVMGEVQDARRAAVENITQGEVGAAADNLANGYKAVGERAAQVAADPSQIPDVVKNQAVGAVEDGLTEKLLTAGIAVGMIDVAYLAAKAASEKKIPELPKSKSSIVSGPPLPQQEAKQDIQASSNAIKSPPPTPRTIPDLQALAKQSRLQRV